MRIYKNDGINGGGIVLEHQFAALSEMEFINNRAHLGAGILKIGSEEINYLKVTFENNIATNGAAAIE